MELKHTITPLHYDGRQGFTRTFMELKRWLHNAWYWSAFVLLVPLWNWNLFNFTSCGVKFLFYSYLYGIETLAHKTRDTNDVPFYSYLYGIETLRNKCGCSHLTVLLVPLWNWNDFKQVDTTLFLIVLLVPLWNWNYSPSWSCQAWE